MKTLEQLQEICEDIKDWETCNNKEYYNNNQKWYSEKELKKILNDYRVNKEDIKSLPRYSKHYNDAIDDIYYALFG